MKKLSSEGGKNDPLKMPESPSIDPSHLNVDSTVFPTTLCLYNDRISAKCCPGANTRPENKMMRDPHFYLQCHASVMEKLGRVSAKALGPIYESGTAAYLVLPESCPPMSPLLSF